MLIDTLNTLTETFFALTITVQDESDAFTIFETLNDRGLDLTIADLLKNYLFSKLHGKITDAELRIYLKSWDTMIESLGKYISPFLKHNWNSKHKPISEKQLYKELKKGLDTKNGIVEFIKDLTSEAEVYNGLIFPEVGYWGDKKIVSLLGEVEILGISQCFPVLLAAKAKFDDKGFCEVLLGCINLSFRYSTVCNLHNNVLEGFYSSLANNIRTGKTKEGADVNSKFVTKTLKTLWPADDIYDTSFENLSIKTSAIPKYILRKINDNLDRGKESVASDSVTLEHIIPQKPKKEYLQMLNKDRH